MDRRTGFGIFFLILAIAGTATGRQLNDVSGSKTKALFVFGDSYADTGNRDKNASVWNYPYGMTWPGKPTGRAGNGHILTDFVATAVFGIPSPTPYAAVVNQTIEHGINFAVVGSGITFAYGFTPLGTQIDNFEKVLKTGAYSPSFLAQSVSLVSNVGNDYGAANYTATELQAVILQVVEGTLVSLRRLYDLGVHNVIVLNLAPLNCVPNLAKRLNFTNCDDSFTPAILAHNALLLQGVTRLNELWNANFIILDQYNSFYHLLNNTASYGIKERIVPCCLPLDPLKHFCGDVDAEGKQLYSVCATPSEHTFWDNSHPTETTWIHITKLYHRVGFVIGAANLAEWVHSKGMRSPTPAPGPGPLVLGGALGQLETALNALLAEEDYSEAIGLLQAVNLAALLDGVPARNATIFLPNNEAFQSVPASQINELYGENKVLPFVAYHAVSGFLDSSRLLAFTTAVNLTTFGGEALPVEAAGGSVLVGPEQAEVVGPNLYKVDGQVVIHGISKLLFSPTL